MVTRGSRSRCAGVSGQRQIPANGLFFHPSLIHTIWNNFTQDVKLGPQRKKSTAISPATHHCNHSPRHCSLLVRSRSCRCAGGSPGSTRCYGRSPREECVAAQLLCTLLDAVPQQWCGIFTAEERTVPLLLTDGNIKYEEAKTLSQVGQQQSRNTNTGLLRPMVMSWALPRACFAQQSRAFSWSTAW